MNGKNKAKWIIGVTGTAFSAFVLSQFAMGDTNTIETKIQAEITENMSKEEKGLVQLDWTNFSTSTITYSDTSVQTSDRQSKRS